MGLCERLFPESKLTVRDVSLQVTVLILQETGDEKMQISLTLGAVSSNKTFWTTSPRNVDEIKLGEYAGKWRERLQSHFAMLSPIILVFTDGISTRY